MVFIEVLDEVAKLVNDEYTVVADYVGGFEVANINFYKQGETKFAEIAAASIIAKVYRDSLMSSLDKYFPHYDLWAHKGYGTKKHLELIKKFGTSSIHRKSFLTNHI
jgi:ribonuclease HII